MAKKKKTTKSSTTRASSKAKKEVKKERGTILTIALILIIIHGIVAAFLYSTLRTAPEVQRSWVVTLSIVHSLANIAAAVGIFYWKKWGLYVYAGSAIIALVIGLVAAGMWSVFYMVLPVAILGWLLREKWDYFN